MTIRLKFTSREGAEDAPSDMCGAVISISDPGSEPVRLAPGWFSVHSVQFHDIDLEKPINAHLRAEILKWKKPLTEDQAGELVAYIHRIMATKGVTQLLVHCEAGISRSAAVAKWIADTYHLPSLGPATKLHNRHVYKLLREAHKRKP